jgi:monoamine oxidase
VTADHVICAVPTGQVIRDIDWTQAGLSALTLSSFQMRLGAGVKIALQFSDQVWNVPPNAGTGNLLTDTVVTSSWQEAFISSNGTYTGAPGDMAPPLQVILNTVAYPNLPAHAPLDSTVLNKVLGVDNLLWPDPIASSHYINKAWMSNWPLDPQAKGTYSYYGVGQMSQFADSQSQPSGNLHFAGEHTATLVQTGTMHGAIVSGERVACEVLTACGIPC